MITACPQPLPLKPCSASLSDKQREPMSSASNPPQVPDRDNLPLKKRDQRWNLPPPQQHHRQYDDASFKAPYSDKSQAETCLKQTCPLPKWVPALYQPWMHTYTATRSIPQVLSAFREHQGWTGWRESNPLHVGWDFSHPFQHRNNLSGMLTCQTGHHHPSRFSTRSVNSEGLQSIDGRHDSEQGKTLRDKNLNTQLQINGRSRGPYLKRSRKTEYFPKVSRSPLSSSSPRSAHEVLQVHKPPKPVRQLISGHSFMRYSKPSNTYISMRDKESRSSLLTSSQQDSFSSRTPYHLPSLPPHFVVGSLIELRDGRLRKVEHLQTEDFLLGSLARPDLRLSCCTVQSITPSASSSSISRLLILLHDQQSQVKGTFNMHCNMPVSDKHGH